MCIAIVKPKFADFPTKKQFENCFITNPDGAGFMYSDGENLIIKKGFMTFEDFMKAFENENISKDKLVFFHFRIATHGLKDGGNTHPFPISTNILVQRSNELIYKGYGLIHNGVIRYEKYEFFKHDPEGIISDTMLLAMKIKENLDNKKEMFEDFESAIVYNLIHKDKVTENLINEVIGFNKIAIMNEKEEYVKYGNWIEDNGVFYSNDDYDFDETKYQIYCSSLNNFNGYSSEFCSFCGNVLEYNKWSETNIGDCCNECCNSKYFKKCKDCGIYVFQDSELEEYDLCDDCLEDYYNDLCDCCFKKEGTIITDNNERVCSDCYNKMLNAK